MQAFEFVHDVCFAPNVVKAALIASMTLCMLGVLGVPSKTTPIQCEEVRKLAFDNLSPGLTLSEDPHGLISVKKGESFIVSFDCDRKKEKPVAIAFFGNRQSGEEEIDHMQLFAKFASLITHCDPSIFLSKLTSIRDDEKKSSPGAAPARSIVEIGDTQLMCTGDSVGSMCAAAINGVDLR